MKPYILPKIDGILHKGAIAFISEDKLHDCEQVEAFEKRAFQIIRERIPHAIDYWIRWSDGCGGQFKSRFTMKKLEQSLEEFNVKRSSWGCFEAHEGKNSSDSIGSIVKCAFLKAIADHNEGILSARDIVELLRVVPDATEKFSFFIIEEFPEISRPDNAEREAYVIKDISKMHSFQLSDDGIRVRRVSCVACTARQMCNDCLSTPPAVEFDDESSDDDTSNVVCQDEPGSDSEDSDSEEDDSRMNEKLRTGDIVWACYKSVWYPARIACTSEIPRALTNQVQTKGLIPVFWYGENKYSAISHLKIDTLSENRIDASRASHSADMMMRYNLALGDLNRD